MSHSSFGPNKEFSNTAEFYLTENEEGNFTIAQYIDGEEQIYEDTEITFKTVEEVNNNPPMFSTLGINISYLADCLGISAGLATTIAGFCGVGCALTAGTECIVCLSFVAGFNLGGNIGCFKNAYR
ncbi:hypothetical protein [Mesobacillus maritimus]|uniref:Uncharacterized protein n=1 Tax=Mesobacillus maritimus TaxID=1643336 RepID=A0ABS7K952_9BACI|nr:hypothetical protein [Mesobacillus maritimus]MBY0098793.1 hypothetical protein [Mesobacillus maritimus]